MDIVLERRGRGPQLVLLPGPGRRADWEPVSDLLAHEDWIKEEVLAVEIRADGGSGEPEIAKA